MEIESTLFWNFTTLVTTVSTAVIYWYGGLSVIEGTMTAGELYTFTSYLGHIHGPLVSIINNWLGFIRHAIAFERVYELLDMPIEVNLQKIKFI